MNRILCVLSTLCLILSGCGEDGGPSSLSSTSGSAPTYTSSSPHSDPRGSPAKYGKDEACTSLAGCSPPAGTLLTFGGPVIFGLTACTISRARVVVAGNGFVAILRANCQGSSALYSVRLSQSGASLADPVRVSVACDERTNSVDKFAVDAGSASVLAAYSCNASTTTTAKSLHIVTLDLNGQVVASRSNIRSSMTSNFLVRWHNESAQFALAGPTWLQRYSPAGQEIGGAVGIPQNGYHTEDITDLRVSSTSWQVIKGSSSYGSLNCSKVIPSGQLTCTNQRLNAYATAESSNLLISRNYNWGFTRSLFSPDTCTDSLNTDIGSGEEVDAVSVYGSTPLPGSYHAVLYRTYKQTLAVAAFHRDASSVAVINPVANIYSVDAAQFGVGGDGKLFVMWVEGNTVKVARGI
jgi:hypothetical protein